MWWTSKKQVNEIKGITNAITPFVTDTLAKLDAEDLDEASRKRRYAIYYMYGAVLYLAEYDGLAKDSKQTLVGDILGKHMDVGHPEIEKLPVTAEHADGARETAFMIEGASALRLWVTTDERARSARYLKQLLDNPDCSGEDSESDNEKS